MGLKKLNSEYNSRYKTFAVHRPVTTKAKTEGHPSDCAPEALESSRRAGLLSSQFLQVSEPALQRRRIVPYKHNHNILSTSTVKELNDREWLEAVGNDEDGTSSHGNVKRKDVTKTEDTEYNSSFAKQPVEKDSPIILASKAKLNQKTQENKRHTTKRSAPKRPDIEKSPERLPPAGIPTYMADPNDKRLLRPCEDLAHPVPSQEQTRNSQTEYSERYKTSTPTRKDEKPILKTEETNNIDVATYKKVLLQRNDAYGFPTRPSTSPGNVQSSTKDTVTKKHRKPSSARRSSLDSKNSGSYISERREMELAKTYSLPKSKQRETNVKTKGRNHTRISRRRSLDESSSSSIHLQATKNLKKGIEKETAVNRAIDRKSNNSYADSVSSRHSQSNKNEMNYKMERLYPTEAQPAKETKYPNARRRLEEESVSSISSATSFERRKRNEKLKTEKRSNVKSDTRKSSKQAWEDQPVIKGVTRGSTRISRATERSRGDVHERGRSPTPEMRTAGQSRRHHLDVTTGSNNPLASGPDPWKMKGLSGMKYERGAYDPSRYSDAGESLNLSRSSATWSDRGS